MRSQRYLVLVIACIGLLAIAPSLFSLNQDPQDKIEQANQWFQEKSYKKALTNYQEVFPTLSGETRAKVYSKIARSFEGLNRRSKLTEFLSENELPNEFPWNAEILRVKNRVLGKRYGDERKLEAGKRAVELLKSNGEKYREDCVAAMFELIDSYAQNWRYQFDHKEWEKIYWKENPKEIELSYSDWSRLEGLKMDRMRRTQVLKLYQNIYDYTKVQASKSKALFDRACYHLVTVGTGPLASPNQKPSIQELIDIHKQLNSEKDMQDKLKKWAEAGLAAMADLEQILSEDPNGEYGGHSAFLRGHTSEHYQGDLVKACELYESCLTLYPESQWSDNCRKRIQIIRQESITFPNPRVYPAGKTPILDIKANNVKKVLCQLFPIQSLPDEVKDSSQLKAKAFSYSGLEEHLSWDLETGCLDDHKVRTSKLQLPVREAGAYLLRIHGKKSSRECLIIISDYSITLNSGEQEAIAWVTHSESGEPIQNADVLFRIDVNLHNQPNISTTHSMKTDNDGIARWTYPPNFQPQHLDRGIQVTAMASYGKHIAPLNSTWANRDWHRSEKWIYYLETDRPAYRPGQKVNFKVHIRYWDGESYVTHDPEDGKLGGRKVKVEFLDPRQQVAHEYNSGLTLGSDVSGSFELGKEPTLGMYNIRVHLDGSAVNSRNYDSRAFRVEEYRLPEFEVTIESPKKQYLIGDSIPIEFKANFLSGEALRGGKTRIRVTRTGYSFNYQPPRRTSWFGQSSRNEHNYWNQEEIFSTEGTLDAEGRSSFILPTESLLEKGNSNFNISVWVTDSSQREETASLRLPITTQEFFAHITPELKLYSPGEGLQVRLRTMKPDKTPVTTTGKLQISKRRDEWVEKDGEKISLTHWDQIDEIEIATNEIGEFLIEESIQQEGEFQLAFTAQDSRGNLVEAKTTVWVVGAEFTGREYTLRGLEIMASQREFKIAEQARFVILSQAADATIMVVRSGGGRILDVSLLQCKGKIGQYQFEIQKGDTPNFYVNAYIVDKRELLSGRVACEVPPEQMLLTASLETSAEVVQPGQEVNLSLRVVDFDGKPVAGSFSLALFDRALLQIQGEITENPHRYFYNRKWGYGMRTSFTGSMRSRSHHQWKLGSKPLPYRSRSLPSWLRRTWRHRLGYLSNDFAKASDQLQLGIPMDRYADFGLEAPTSSAAPSESRLGSESAPMAKRASGKKARARSAMRVQGDMDKNVDEEGAGAVFAFDDSGEDYDSEELEEAQGGSPMAQAKVRKNFSATAVWKERFKTDATGQASCKFAMPDSLTSWSGVARGITTDGRTMEARVQLATRKNIRARLAAPRFFREGDQVELSVIAQNSYPENLESRISFVFPSSLMSHVGSIGTDCVKANIPNSDLVQLTYTTMIPANSRAQIDLPMSITGVGMAKLVATVKTAKESDALERDIPSLEFGLDRYLAQAGTIVDLDGENQAVSKITIPEDSKSETREVEILLSPSPAIALVESLPYLVKYPYGCVEQTLHRFMPAAIVAKVLSENGINIEEILPEKPSNMPVGYFGDLKERPLAVLRAEDLTELIASGAKRLRGMQNSNGSFGWWAGAPGDPYITALVVDAYATAKDADLKLDYEPMHKAANWLKTHLIGRDLKGELKVYDNMNLNQFALIGRALFRAKAHSSLGLKEAQEMMDLSELLYRFRSRLSPQAMALLAVGIKALNISNDQRPAILLRNLENFEVRKEKWGTTQYGKKRGYSWWYESGVESTARVLEAFLDIAPNDERIGEMVRWLLENREGSHYDSTRSTAVVAMAISKYLGSSQELQSNLQVSVSWDGVLQQQLEIKRENLFSKRHSVSIPANLLTPGEHTLSIRRAGKGNLYWSSSLSFYSYEDPMPAAGNRIEVERSYYRIVEEKLTREEKYLDNNQEKTRIVTYFNPKRIPLAEGDVLKTGERVLVEIKVDSAQAFRYLLFEDHKAAGLEAVDVRSGYVGGVFGYREFRDAKVLHFASRLPEGASSFTYELRAERPGVFKALPTKAHAMYLPHVRANSNSHVIQLKSQN